jgi:hypothetical protein
MKRREFITLLGGAAASVGASADRAFDAASTDPAARPVRPV